MVTETPLFSQGEVAEIKREISRIQEKAEREIATSPHLEAIIRKRCERECDLLVRGRTDARRRKICEAFIWAEAIAAFIIAVSLVFDWRIPLICGWTLFATFVANASWKSAEGLGNPILHRAVLAISCFIIAFGLFNIPTKLFDPDAVYAIESKRNGVTFREEMKTGRELQAKEEEKNRRTRTTAQVLCLLGAALALFAVKKASEHRFFSGSAIPRS